MAENEKEAREAPASSPGGGSGSGTLSQEMRRATKDIHTLSDHLVNLKLGLAMSDDQVWAEGVLLFYDVFRTLEETLDRTSDSLLGDMAMVGLTDRTGKFEQDLEFYLGPAWRDDGRRKRQQVQNYVEHLLRLEKMDPHLLVAYFYHLYMGLLSGGQILSGKRRLLRKMALDSGGKSDESELAPGMALTHFDEPIKELKRRYRQATDDVGQQLDEETRRRVIKEGQKVLN